MSSFLPAHVNATQSLREVSLAASHSPSGQRTGNRWSNPPTCPSSSPVTNAHHPLKMVTDFHLSFWQFSAIACNNSKKKLVFGLYYISVSILTPFEELKKKKNTICLQHKLVFNWPLLASSFLSPHLSDAATPNRTWELDLHLPRLPQQKHDTGKRWLRPPLRVEEHLPSSELRLLYLQRPSH